MQLRSTAEVITLLQIYSILAEACGWSNSTISNIYSLLKCVHIYNGLNKYHLYRVIFDNEIKTSDANSIFKTLN